MAMLALDPEALVYLAVLKHSTTFSWPAQAWRDMQVSFCQKLGTHPDKGVGKQCKNINKGMTGVKHK